MPKTFNINWKNKISQNKLQIKMTPHINFSFYNDLKMEIVSLSPLEDFNLRCSFVKSGFIQAEYIGSCFLGLFHLKNNYIFKKECICDLIILDFSKKISNIEMKMIFDGEV